MRSFEPAKRIGTMALVVTLVAACGGQAAPPTQSESAPSAVAAGTERRSDATGRPPLEPQPSAGTSAAAQSTAPASSAAATARVTDMFDAVVPVEASLANEGALFDVVAAADVVLLGEPSHGSHEVYQARAELSARLIDDAGFSGVVIEADWPEAWRVDRYVRGIGPDRTAAQALGEFDEFPVWMWRNEPFAAFVEWLRERNSGLSYAEQAGVYGMDLYSVAESVLAAPPQVQPFDAAAAARMERRYQCAGATGTETSPDPGPSCAGQLRSALDEAESLTAAVPATDPAAADRSFSAAQNARIVVNGRRYFLGEEAAGEQSWNIRDQHMAETLWVLRDHLMRTGRTGQLVVWAHNSHIGDASATEVAERAQLNLGQLVRDNSEVDAALVGFSTYTGTVTAADYWDADAEQMDIVPALPESHEAVLHEVALGTSPNFYVVLGDGAPAQLDVERLERYIGAIYRPDSERISHYLTSRLADEYDVVVHIDRTTAVQALETE